MRLRGCGVLATLLVEPDPSAAETLHRQPPAEPIGKDAEAVQVAERRDEDGSTARLFAAHLTRRGRDSGGAEGAGSARSSSGRRASLGQLARTGGRVAIWAIIALLLLRGLGDLLSDAERQPSAPSSETTEFPGPAEQAFAVRVARLYLSGETARPARASSILDSVFASGLRGRFAPASAGKGATPSVAEATVSGVKPTGADRAVVTVACVPGGPGRSSVRYVAVPVARDSRGGLIAYDLPSLVAGPPAGDVEAAQPAPLSGPSADEIDRLVRRFLAAYLAGADQADLSLFVAPDATVGSVGAGLELAGVSEIGQLESTEPNRLLISATAEVRDTRSGATYPARYRLELVRGERLYVESIEGEVR